MERISNTVFNTADTTQIPRTFNEHEAWMLRGTGFNVALEITSFAKTVCGQITAGLSYQEAVTQAVRQSEHNIQGFVAEYLKRLGVLRYGLDLVEDKGRYRLMKYGKALSEMTDPSERHGAFIKSLTEAGGMLGKGKDGSIAVITSPPGPSGRTDNLGGEIIHQDTQTWLMKKIGVEVEAVTVVSDMDLAQNRQFLGKLYQGNLLDRARFKLGLWMGGIDWVSGTAVLLKDRSFKEVVEVMEEVRGHELGMVYRELASNRTTQELSTECQRFVDEFASYGHKIAYGLAYEITQYLKDGGKLDSSEDGMALLKRSIVYKGLAAKLGNTILKLSALINTQGVDPDNLSDSDSARLRESVSELTGCEGGGGGKKGQGFLECQEIKCKHCGWKPDSRQLLEVIAGKLMACPNPKCGKRP